MRLTIITVGRLRPGPEPLTIERRIEREGELLRAACPKGARVIALHSSGKTLTSEALARRLGAWRDQAIGDVALVIGGVEGLHSSIVSTADLELSFGAVTWPHLLMRALVAEQIYRAQQILAGHPYHRS